MASYRLNRPTVLYRYFDQENQLLYIGVSLNLASRMSQHGKTPWGYAVAKVTAQWFDCGVEALAAERIAIRTEQPKYNVRSSRCKADDEEGYWQTLERHCLNYVKAYLWSSAMANGWQADISTAQLCDLTSMSTSEVEACLDWLESNEKICRNTELGKEKLVRVLDTFFEVFEELPGNWRLDFWVPRGATE